MLEPPPHYLFNWEKTTLDDSVRSALGVAPAAHESVATAGAQTDR